MAAAIDDDDDEDNDEEEEEERALYSEVAEVTRSKVRLEYKTL